ncbi:hypothetical protein [Flavitalea sp.]|nr:hypothetical protein [Flavitalea sp.]
MFAASVVIGLMFAAIILYVGWKRLNSAELQPDSDSARPSQLLLPTETRQNDKLVIVKDVAYMDIKKVLIGFCNMYNKDNYLAIPRLIKLMERQFAIVFPYDIDFQTYCYFINYLEFPLELERSLDVTGWATVNGSEPGVIPGIKGKKIMLFIPTLDTEHDNVYVTTDNNMGFKLGFAVGKQIQLPGMPEKRYSSPAYIITELQDKEFEEFR